MLKKKITFADQFPEQIQPEMPYKKELQLKKQRSPRTGPPIIFPVMCRILCRLPCPAVTEPHPNGKPSG